ncbi:uncharacterized protein BJ171DRAFT_87010 [Polychytrium aggregatum]|nr:uncharacterized protein BJ171DRAFT_87010 [Polychytrium aggregatum]KAI9190551.1 hypothetical protein BJ171DRAFT_87010 [Polychytrium aggregatum]
MTAHAPPTAPATPATPAARAEPQSRASVVLIDLTESDADADADADSDADADADADSNTVSEFKVKSEADNDSDFMLDSDLNSKSDSEFESDPCEDSIMDDLTDAPVQPVDDAPVDAPVQPVHDAPVEEHLPGIGLPSEVGSTVIYSGSEQESFASADENQFELDEDTIVVDQGELEMEDVAVAAEPTVTPTAVSSKDATVSLKRKRDVQDRAEDDPDINSLLVSAIPLEEKNSLFQQFLQGQQKLRAIDKLESCVQAGLRDPEAIRAMTRGFIDIMNAPIAETKPKPKSKPAAPVIEELPDERWSFQKLDVAALKAAFAEPVDPNPANFKTVHQLIDADAVLTEAIKSVPGISSAELLYAADEIVFGWFREWKSTQSMPDSWMTTDLVSMESLPRAYIAHCHSFILVILHLFLFKKGLVMMWGALLSQYRERLTI